jgi:hypothetical protein
MGLGLDAVTKRERKRLAEALLDSSSTAQYLLSRLGDEWEAVTPAVLMKLGKRYGAAVVTDALRGIRMQVGGTPLYQRAELYIVGMTIHNPVGYLETVCRAVAEDQAS